MEIICYNKFMKIGDIIYAIDYEKTHNSYTIVNIRIVTNNPYVKCGVWYDVVSNDLSRDINGNTIFSDCVDNNGKYYSSPEKAMFAYHKRG